MLEDGKQAKTIIAELEKHRAEWPPEITSITKGNLSMWRKGGYKDWLRDQSINSQFQLLAETAADAPNPMALANLLAQLNMYQLYLRLAAFDPSTIKPESLADPAEHARVTNASSRAIRSAIAVQKQMGKDAADRDAAPRRPPQSSDPSDPNPDNLQPFSRENLRKFERIIGLSDGTYSNSRTHPDGWYYPDRPSSTLSDNPLNPNPNPSTAAPPSATKTPPPPVAEITQPSSPPAAKTETTETSPPNSDEPTPPPPPPEDRGYSPIELLNYMIHHSR
jgi:hypothetical protein